jgi:hypothetical protein
MLQTFSRAALHSTLKEFKEVRELPSFPASVASHIKQFPKNILYPTEYFPLKDAGQQKIIDQFVQIMENFLGVKKTTFSLAGRWTENPPAEANGKSLDEYAYKVAPLSPLSIQY